MLELPLAKIQRMRAGNKIRFARTLRTGRAEAEQRLWYHLRDRRLLGHKFRRQCPIGPYLADFACLAGRLVVELDGSQHLDSQDDLVRANFLQGRGFTSLRFWNHQVLAQTDLVCERIACWLGAYRHDAAVAPLPTPLEKGKPA